MTGPRVAVIVNPRAGRARTLRRVVEALPGAMVHAPETLTALDAAAVALLAEAPAAIAVCGGDGTVHRALTALARAADAAPLPPIALVPTGTMNTIARAVGVRRRPVAVARALARGDTHAVSRTLIAADDSFGFLVGLGFWARFLDAYDAASGPGPARAAAVLARGLASTAVGGRFVRDLFAPVRARVALDGEWLEPTRWTMLAAGTVDQVGLGFSPFAGIGEAPGLLHALAFSSGPLQVARQLPTLYRGGAPRPPDLGRRGRSMVIEGEAPLAWAVDGDPHPPVSRLHLRPGPTIPLLLPR